MVVTGLVEIAGILKRMRHDSAGQPPELQRALAYLEQNLFDKDLTVSGLSKACNVHQGAIHSLFRIRLDHTPWSYIRNRRMEAATHLLCESDIDVWQIAHGVGYRSVTSFCKLFKKWAGISPSAYRSQYQHQGLSQTCYYNKDFRQKLIRGELEPEQLHGAVQFLTDLYSLAPSARQTRDSVFEEELRAEVVWRKLREKSFEEQSTIVRCQYGFRTPALFDLLLEKSREEHSICSPQLTVERAQLALFSLDGAADAVGSALADLRTRGLAWLGNARRLALDFPGAEQAFNDAELAWELPRANKDPGPLADLFALKAMLRYFQRCFEEALDLNRRALTLLRKQHAPVPLARALIARAAITGSAGRPEETFDELEEALRILRNGDIPDLRVSCLVNLAIAYASAGHTEKAKEVLPGAKALARGVKHRTAEFHLQWVEGLVAKAENAIQSAELLFSKARRGFADLGETDYEAVVSLDLATLYLETNRSTDALSLAAQTIPVFEAFRARRESTAALQLIRNAFSQPTVSLPILEELRTYLRCLSKDPWFGSRVKLLG